MYYRIQLRTVPRDDIPDGQINFYKKTSGVTFTVRSKLDVEKSVSAILGNDKNNDVKLPMVVFYDSTDLNTRKMRTGIYSGSYIVPNLTDQFKSLSSNGYFELSINDLLKDNPDIKTMFKLFSIRVERVK